MKLTAIEPTRSPVGKLRLRFDDGKSLLVYPAVIREYGLVAGQELPEAAFAALEKSNARAGSRDRAVRIISASAVTRGELEQRLRRKGESEDDARQTVAWLDELHLLDDRQVAEQVVRSGAARGYGAARIRQMLYQKHVPKELWDEALQQLPQQDDAIDEFLQRRFRGIRPDRVQCKKATDALLRRGHNWADIRRALERYAPEEDFCDE